MNSWRRAHERISAALSTRYPELEWRKVGFWPGTDLADRYGVPDHDEPNHRDTEAQRRKSKAKAKRQMANLKEPQRHRDTGAEKQRAKGKRQMAKVKKNPAWLQWPPADCLLPYFSRCLCVSVVIRC
jgi:hypothetical protein